MKKQNDTLRPVSIEEVQKMLEEKSLALEKLQSELEIESALERVRAVAMSMKKSEDLFDVCKVMYEELTALNFTNIRNAQIAINLGGYKSWMIFEYSKHGEIKMKKVDSGISPLLKEIAEEMSNSKDALKLFQKQIKGEEFKKWRAWRLKEDALKDPRVEEANSMCFYLHGIEAGILGISSFDAITNEQVEILSRFKNVFDLSYRRYADVAKAEAQARESQIQLALERVRARTMAMQHSDELPEAANLLFQQVQSLGMPAWSAGYCIWDDDLPAGKAGKKGITLWMSSEGVLQPPFRAPLTEDPSFIHMREAYERGETFFVDEIGGEELVTHYKYMRTLPVVGEILDSIIEAGHPLPTFQIFHLAYFSQGFLLFITYETVPEAHDIFKRFAKVFEQTYTRFLDLQKAEAQAREAKIEASLERVRARTMAMYKSENLSEVVEVVFKELDKLELDILRCGIGIINKEKRNADAWITSVSDEGKTIQVSGNESMDLHPLLQGAYDAWLSNADFSYVLEGEDLVHYYKTSGAGKVRLPDSQLILSASEITTQYYQIAVFEAGGLFAFSANAFSEEAKMVMKRFAVVFNQSYTRFLDLQKAEAQAREARIEVALEKIRSRSLGMHHSVEIKDVVSILFEKLKELNLAFDGGTAIHLFTEGSRNAVIWVASPLAEPSCVNLPYDENAFENNPIILDIWHAKETGEHIYNKFYSFEEKNRYFDYVFKHNDFIAVPKSVREFIPQADSYTASFIAEKNSLLGANSWTRQLFSDNDFEVLKRVARVFEQAYIRFLDLQKAEAQARESQIELGLERVRARAMAMQKSDDLAGAVAIIFEELDKLDIGILRCGIGILNKESRSVNVWTTSISDENVPVQISGDESMDSHPLLQGAFNAWLKQEDYSYTLQGKDLTDYYKSQIAANFKLPESQSLVKGHEDICQYYFLSTFQAGGLFAFRETPFPDEAKKLMRRFAGVFNLTYKRFVDLKTAEAQAREAKIEAALERVRSRTMGMQKSEELKEVIQVVYDQFVGINIHIEHTGFIMDYKARNDMHIWLADKHEVPSLVTIPYFDCAHWNSFNEAKENGTDFFANHLSFEEKNKFYQDLFKLIPGLPEEVKEYYFSCPGLAISTVLLENVGLYIENFSGIPYSDGENNTLMRFGKVFQQTYTRFLDLQKAEAQARESQIQLGLERVRARAMAMQHSDHLKDVIEVIGHQLHELGLYFDYVNFVVGDTTNGFDTWNVSFGQTNPIRFFIPYINNRLFNEMLKVRKDGLEFNAYTMTEEETFIFVTHLIENGILKYLPEEALQKRLHSKGMSVATAVLNEVFLTMANYSAIPYTDEENSILKRFGNAFQQAFTRFIDLQKAEAQAREAEIELALERVRARTMAMQKSDELREAVLVIYEQLQQLGFDSNACNIIIIDEESGAMQYWVSGFTQEIFPEGYHVPYLRHPYHETLLAASRQQKKYAVMEYSGKMKKSFDEIFFTQTDFRNIPEEAKKFMKGLESVKLSTAFFSFGVLQILGPMELTGEKAIILQRFAKVFEQTYTRFLDLQKAEALARESQIQLALERVRARTMAMQHSDELKDAAALLFQQAKALGVPAYSCGYNIWEKKDKTFTSWMSTQDGSIINGVPDIPLTEDANFIRYVESKQKGEQFFVLELRGERMQEHYEYLKTIPAFKAYFDYAISVGFDLPETQIHYLANFSQGNLLFISLEPCPEFHDVFKRFASVFEQTYTRFLDLQKAEAQARESQIQLALERVRARTMAMQKSDELSETASLLFKQINDLGVQTWTSGFNIWENDDTSFIGYNPSPTGGITPPYHIPSKEDSFFINIYEAKKRGEDFLVFESAGKSLAQTYSYMKTLPVVKDVLNGIEDAGIQLPTFQINHCGFFSHGFLLFITLEPYPNAHDIFKRFAKVFEQTYTRFLDLQKAEAQSREAQIELGLERVRARAMAMQKSDELKELIGTVSTELGKLDIILDRCFIITYDTQTMGSTWWMANPETPGESIGLFVKYHEYPPYLAHINAWEERKVKWQYILEGEAKKAWDKFLFVETELSQLPDFVIANMTSKEKVYLSSSFNNFGYLTLATLQPLSSEQFDIMLRFAKVFDLTYTRFNDLQKAEAQAREAQIELGLERVRARAMAMQKSDELKELIGTVFTELTKLDLVLTRCLIMIFDPKTNDSIWWMANSEDPSNPMGLSVNYHEMPPYLAYIKTWQERKLKWQYILEGKNKTDWDDYIFSRTGLSQLPDFVIAGMRAPERVYLSASFNNFGNLTLATLEPLSIEHADILLRFAKVFDLTYTRFNDLKQAEAQAREATIEAALERVRGKAMAMHNSNDVSSTASLVFTELRKLGINPIRCGVGLLTKDSRKAQLYSATSSADGDSLALIGWVQLSDHPVLTRIYDTWLNDEEYYPELQGEEMRTYYQLLLKGLPVPVPDTTGSPKQYGHFIPFSIGCLYAWSDTHYDQSKLKILKRFASIIDLTFRRYIELQKSEANARDAIKQSALDRIRADIASMRTTTDLERITPLIWNELTILGIPFIRCGIFIMDDSQELIHTFLSTPEGKAIAAFHLPYTTPGNISQVLKHWQSKKNYVDHWDESSFTEFAEILIKQGGLTSAELYLKTIPRGGFYLHFVPFLQGMLYVGNTTRLGEDEVRLVQSIADAFSTAYARYEDFNKLEFAKQQVEKTLVDLKQAQTQLIQSEKMASLGELTAGIAHEIQNPLNFVNNFSEVNAELLVEMKNELAIGNGQSAIEIAGDIKQNLEKIIHHGKRADAIVKGMLQHSRISAGQKELTNINTLADEYLRLAYHGMRAKDNFFNVNIKTDFDESIEKIKIIPQDIGRVILNLITNAFYAVNEKKKQQQENYEPIVTVSTKRLEGKVEIRVEDNGNGIPQKVLDKIFQPFFTTKPTGQGTGLGLSLSYDIIKAHGGEIKVETKEGEGTTFIIQLAV